MATITGQDILQMVWHWLNTPTGSYLGSDYGSDCKSLLQNPQSVGIADKFLKKLKKDVPVLAILPQGSVNLYAVPDAVDKLTLLLDIAGTALTIPASHYAN
jgi:hypothetical protein